MLEMTKQMCGALQERGTLVTPYLSIRWKKIKSRKERLDPWNFTNAQSQNGSYKLKVCRLKKSIRNQSNV